MHHLSLAVAYGAVVVLYLLAHRGIPALRVGMSSRAGALGAPGPGLESVRESVRDSLPDRRTRESRIFARPWREFCFALLAGVAVLGIGQLYMRGFLLSPEDSVLAASLNQILIFSPVLLLPMLRRQGPETLYAARERLPLRAGAGVLLAFGALAVYSLAAGGTPSFPALLAGTWRVDRVPMLVQVLLEDLAIGLLLCRLAAALRRPSVAAVIVGGLFAAGHIPAMLAQGASAVELARLVLDFVLAFGVILAIVRTRDVIWFFPVHFVLDATQFLTSGG